MARQRNGSRQWGKPPKRDRQELDWRGRSMRMNVYQDRLLIKLLTPKPLDGEKKKRTRSVFPCKNITPQPCANKKCGRIVTSSGYDARESDRVVLCCSFTCLTEYQQTRLLQKPTNPDSVGGKEL